MYLVIMVKLDTDMGMDYHHRLLPLQSPSLCTCKIYLSVTQSEGQSVTGVWLVQDSLSRSS